MDDEYFKHMNELNDKFSKIKEDIEKMDKSTIIYCIS
jgi:hypothetical protein